MGCPTLSAAVMSWALLGGGVLDGTEAASAIGSEESQDEVLVALERAQRELSAGRPLDALRSASDAVASDPTLGSAYLMRVQILVELLGPLDEIPTDPHQREIERQWAEQAASDLKRYIELSSLDAESAEQFRQQRTELVEAMQQRQAPASDPDPDVDPDPDPYQDIEPDPDPEPERVPIERPKGFWAGVGLLSGGGVLTGLGVGVLADSQRIERTCISTGPETEDMCSASWNVSPIYLPVGLVSAALGATLFTTGAVLMTRSPPTPRLQRRRRIAAATLLGAAGVALVTSAALGATAGREWSSGDDDELLDDEAALSRIQGMGNAAIAIGSVVPSLIGGGIAFGLGSRSQDR